SLAPELTSLWNSGSTSPAALMKRFRRELQPALEPGSQSHSEAKSVRGVRLTEIGFDVRSQVGVSVGKSLSEQACDKNGLYNPCQRRCPRNVGRQKCDGSIACKLVLYTRAGTACTARPTVMLRPLERCADASS